MSETKPRPRRQSKQARFSTALEKIREGLEEINDIKSDLENWRDGLQGTNLENSDLYSRLDEACDTLDEQTSTIDDALNELDSVEIPRGFGRD